MTESTNPPICDVVCVHDDVVRDLIPIVAGLEGVGEAMSIFADDTRFKILLALSRSELCVCDVGAIVGATTASASYHLRNLYRSGVVVYRRHGKLVYYRLADERTARLVDAALDFAGYAARDSAK